MPRQPQPLPDGPPIFSIHMAVLAKTGEPEDSPSMRNAEMVMSRCSTFGSARVYATHLSRFFRFMRAAGRPPIAADEDDVAMFLSTLRGLAPATQSTIWGVVGAFFKVAVQRTKIGRHPMAAMKRPIAEPLTPTPALTHEGAQRILDSIAADLQHPDRGLAAHRDYAMLAAMIFLCLRATEVSAARWSGISRSGDGLTLSFMGKGRKAATLGLPEPVYEALLAWKKAYEFETGQLILADDPIFLPLNRTSLKVARRRTTKKPLARIGTRSVGRIVADRIADLELNIVGGMPAKRFAAHCLRATGATLALEGGADLLDIQAIMRHAQIGTTQRYLRRQDQRSLKVAGYIGLSLHGGVAVGEEQADEAVVADVPQEADATGATPDSAEEAPAAA